MAPHTQSSWPCSGARLGALPGKVGLGSTIPTEGGGRGARQVDVVPQTPKPSQSKDCAQTCEDSELRVHVSSEHGQKLRGAAGRAYWPGLLILHVCPLGCVTVIALSRSSAICAHF